jgi:hypothetical protein
MILALQEVSQKVSQKLLQKNSQKFIKKFRRDIFGKSILLSQNMIETIIPGLSPEEYYYTYLTQELEKKAVKKFAEYFIDSKMCIPVFKSYTRIEMIFRLTKEHKMEQADAEWIVNEFIKGKDITLSDGNSLSLMKLSSKDKDPKYRFQVRSY